MKPTFFEALENDVEFLSLLGGLICSTSRFENTLETLLSLSNSKKPLGNLFKQLKESQYIGSTLDFHIGFAIGQRNYFIHNLYRNLKDSSEEDFSISQFKNRLIHLREEFRFFSRLLEEQIQTEQDAAANP